MQKWYKVIRPFGQYRVGEFIAPVGLQRDRLHFLGLIEEQFSLSKDRPAAIQRAVAPAPEVRVAAPEPAPEVEPEPVATEEKTEAPKAKRGRRKQWK